MADEIERKFLVRGAGWRAAVIDETRIRQGYLAVNDRCVVRVRVHGSQANLNVKSAGLEIARKEYEYAIPPADAEEMLGRMSGGVEVIKTRHRVRHGGQVWEVDVFEGDNQGLVMAEIELDSVHEEVDLPDWVGREVSGDPRYRNNNLATRPYCTWKTEDSA